MKEEAETKTFYLFYSNKWIVDMRMVDSVNGSESVAPFASRYALSND